MAAWTMREAELKELPDEVTFRNPETIAACLTLMAFAAVCLRPSLRRHRWLMPALLAVNLVPLMMFAHRFIPVQPMEMWRRLNAEGTEQKRVAALLSPGDNRLLEVATNSSDRLYPNAMAHLFGVRTVHGYSSLKPNSFIMLSHDELQKWMPQAADYIYESKVPGAETGVLKKNPTPGMARFQWRVPGARGIHIDRESLNEIRLSFDPGTAAELLWTDTYYPGWSPRIGQDRVAIRRAEPFYSSLLIPAGAQSLVLDYRPTYCD